MTRRLRLGRRTIPDGRVQIYFEPRDLWVGVFVAPTAWYLVLIFTLVIRVARRPQPTEPVDQDLLDEAMFAIWLHGDWYWLTRCMTTPARNAAARSVLRYQDRMHDEDDPAGRYLTHADLAWWEDPDYDAKRQAAGYAAPAWSVGPPGGRTATTPT